MVLFSKDLSGPDLDSKNKKKKGDCHDVEKCYRR